MLITEHSIPNTRTTPSSRTVVQQPSRSSRAIPHTTAQLKTTTANLLNLMSKAGDRQSWLLLGLILLPIIGLIRNLMTYGFER